MGQVRLRVDHNTPGPVDEAGVGVTHAVLLVQDRKAVVADLKRGTKDACAHTIIAHLLTHGNFQ